MYYFAQESATPLRATPSETAEMVSQLLFGDVVVALELQDNWLKIRNLDDDYEGWASRNMLLPLLEEDLKLMRIWRYIHERDFYLKREDGSELWLPLGSRIPLMRANTTNFDFKIGYKYWAAENHTALKPMLPPTHIEVTAKKFLNTPYLWGGKSSFGIDCSGFTQTVFRMHGIGLSRDASQQVQQGTKVNFAERRTGDLAFFKKSNQTKVSHVGILSSENEVIHSSGRVRIDVLLPEGIYNTETQTLTHVLLSINRYF